MKRLVLGAIGAGRIGKIHTENILAMPQATLKMITDPYIDEGWAKGHGLAYSLEAADVFNDEEIDTVLIFSPSTFHAEHIIAAAEAGKHIFCEKPIALDPALIKRALGAVAAAGVKMQIGFNRRFDPDFRKVRETVESGAIGDVHMVRVIARDPEPPSPEYVASSGGMFLDMTIHDFDMVRYLSGLEVEEVYAAGAVLIDPEIGAAGDIDTAITTLRLTGGALAVIDNSRQSVYGYDQRVEVFGSRGSITAGNLTPTRTTLMTTDGVVDEKPLYFFLERYQESFRIEMVEFIQAIQNNADTPVNGEAGLISIQVGLAAKASAAQGIPIRVDYS